VGKSNTIVQVTRQRGHSYESNLPIVGSKILNS